LHAEYNVTQSPGISSDTRVSALSGNVNLRVKSRRRRRGAINRFGPVK